MSTQLRKRFREYTGDAEIPNALRTMLNTYNLYITLGQDRYNMFYIALFGDDRDEDQGFEDENPMEFTSYSLPAVLRKAEAWCLVNLKPKHKEPMPFVYEI